MNSLFNVNINWNVYFIIGILILLVAPGISWWAFAALMIALHQFLLVFYSFGYLIPVRYIAGALMCLQMLVGPSFAYSGLDQFQYQKYKMQIPEADYFMYAIPACICFVWGLNIFSRLRGESINIKSISTFVEDHPKLMYIFIGIGFVSSLVARFFGSELGFVFYLLGGFKFIGAFMIIVSGVNLKLAPLLLVFGSIVLSSLGAAMFHDLITWLVFLLAVLAVRYRPPVVTKALVAVGFILLIVVIQQLKGVYREATQFQGKEGSIEDFDAAYNASQKGGLFDAKQLARSNVRINQGFIVTHIMNWVPRKEPFANGEELYRILEAAFLPRIIAPNKLKAGDNSIVTKYSGIKLRQYTSMSLSSLGDAYINFGTFGGCAFMFVLGAVFNWVLIGFYKKEKQFPIALLFTPLVFYFPIRPDTALQTGLGHLVKGCFILYMISIFWKYELSKKSRPNLPAPAAGGTTKLLARSSPVATEGN